MTENQAFLIETGIEEHTRNLTNIFLDYELARNPSHTPNLEWLVLFLYYMILNRDFMQPVYPKSEKTNLAVAPANTNLSYHVSGRQDKSQFTNITSNSLSLDILSHKFSIATTTATTKNLPLEQISISLPIIAPDPVQSTAHSNIGAIIYSQIVQDAITYLSLQNITPYRQATYQDQDKTTYKSGHDATWLYSALIKEATDNTLALKHLLYTEGTDNIKSRYIKSDKISPDNVNPDNMRPDNKNYESLANQNPDTPKISKIAPESIKRDDKKEVVPMGVERDAGLYELVLDSYTHAEERLIRGYHNGKLTTRITAQDSLAAITDRMLEDKGLVPIYDFTDKGEIQIREILGLTDARYNIVAKTGTGRQKHIGNTLSATDRLALGEQLSVLYSSRGIAPEDSAFVNTDLVYKMTQPTGVVVPHAYNFIDPRIVTEERARDDTLKTITVINKNGLKEDYKLRNNTAMAFWLEALQEENFTPVIKKSEILLRDGQKIENSIYIEQIFKNETPVIKDNAHAGTLLELIGINGEHGEAISKMGCSLSLVDATIMPGQVWLPTITIQGKYNNRLTKIQ